jgi:hypothetical protein
MILQLPCTLEKSQSMSNRSWRLVFDTQQEIPGNLIADFNNNLDKFGWLCFLVGQNEIKPEDVADLPELPKEPENTKSPAQRLHAVLYRLWEQKGKNGEFRSYYEIYMERLINTLKERLI